MARFLAFYCIAFFVQLTLAAQPGNFKIACNVFEDTAKDNYDIYSMNTDGSDKKNITNTAGVDWVYHAYKNKLIFISDRDTCHRCYFLYSMNADGKEVKKLSDLQLEDSWISSRNNGTEIIALGRVGKQRNLLFLINLTNGTYRQIITDTVSTKRDPMFLPGGNDIVMAYRPDKALRKTVQDELWKFTLQENKDGSLKLSEDKIQLTHFPKSDTTTAWYEYHAGPPQWNSKYGYISYLSRQNNQTQIYAVFPDLKKHWQATYMKQLTSDSLSNGWHNWSPDGKWLVMDKSTHEGKNFDIYLMNYKTRKTIRLTDSWKTEQAPVFVKIK